MENPAPRHRHLLHFQGSLEALAGRQPGGRERLARQCQPRSRRYWGAGVAVYSPSELWPRSPAERSLLGAQAPPPSWSLFNDAPCAALWERAPRPANRRSDPGASRAPRGRLSRRRRRCYGPVGLAWPGRREREEAVPSRLAGAEGARRAAPGKTRAVDPDRDGRDFGPAHACCPAPGPLRLSSPCAHERLGSLHPEHTPPHHQALLRDGGTLSVLYPSLLSSRPFHSPHSVGSHLELLSLLPLLRVRL